MSKSYNGLGSYMEGLGWVYDCSLGRWWKYDTKGLTVAEQGDEIWKKDLRAAGAMSADKTPSTAGGTGSRADAEA